MLRKLIVLLLVLAVFSLSGCEVAKKLNLKKWRAETYESKEAELTLGAMKAMSAPAALEERSAPAPAARVSARDQEKPTQIKRKITYSAFLKLEVKNVVESMEKLKSIAEKNSGYISNSSVKRYENKSKSGEATLRIPSINLDSAIAQIKKMGEVIDESKTASEITREYYDLEARLKNARAFETRILKLLQTEAKKITDVLQVEQELSRIREKIESLQGSLQYYKNLVELSTLSVDLYEKGVELPSRVNWLQSIIDTFAAAFSAFFSSLGDIIVIVFALAPWIVLITAIIYLIICTRRKKNA